MSLYLNEAWLENTGPLSKYHVKMPFAPDGNPLPTVLVGPNGSGKSVFLSYVVDALIEFGKKAFDDVVPEPRTRNPFHDCHPNYACERTTVQSVPYELQVGRPTTLLLREGGID